MWPYNTVQGRRKTLITRQGRAAPFASGAKGQRFADHRPTIRTQSESDASRNDDSGHISGLPTNKDLAKGATVIVQSTPQGNQVFGQP